MKQITNNVAIDNIGKPWQQTVPNASV